MSTESYTVVGMMSGTSLDGMDLVLCRFSKNEEAWDYKIEKCQTFAYSEYWRQKLTSAPSLDPANFLLLHNEYGLFIGQRINDFLGTTRQGVNLVASHGHTVFHQPEKNFTFQLGSGATLSATCGITTVSDFRSLDIALGGQGAPLVPVGDHLLFNNYQFCLNLGGFANISNMKDGVRIACDICPVNIVANYLSQRIGYEYDKDGKIGQSGVSNKDLVNELNNLGFYSKPAPKSLGREWVESEFMRVMARYEISVENMLSSIYEHMAIQISNYMNKYEKGVALVTGGGAFNKYLMKLIRQRTNSEIIIPDNQIVMFKEALIFAFLGLLRYLKQINCLQSVTGAIDNSCSGIIHIR
jgi:anhydro-N-acetylmuramic acid kinase